MTSSQLRAESFPKPGLRVLVHACCSFLPSLSWSMAAWKQSLTRFCMVVRLLGGLQLQHKFQLRFLRFLSDCWFGRLESFLGVEFSQGFSSQRIYLSVCCRKQSVHFVLAMLYIIAFTMSHFKGRCWHLVLEVWRANSCQQLKNRCSLLLAHAKDVLLWMLWGGGADSKVRCCLRTQRMCFCGC